MQKRGPGAGDPADTLGQGHEDRPFGQRSRAGKNFTNPAPNYPEEGSKEQRDSVLPKVTQRVSGETRTKGLEPSESQRRAGQFGWMGRLPVATPGLLGRREPESAGVPCQG